MVATNNIITYNVELDKIDIDDQVYINGKQKKVCYYGLEPIIDSLFKILLDLKENPRTKISRIDLLDPYSILSYTYTFNGTLDDVYLMLKEITFIINNNLIIDQEIFNDRLECLYNYYHYVEKYRREYSKLHSFECIDLTQYGLDKFDKEGIREFNEWLLSISPLTNYMDDLDKEIYRSLSIDDYETLEQIKCKKENKLIKSIKNLLK